MTFLQIRNRRASIWHETTTTLRGTAAAIVALATFPGGALAQAPDVPLPVSPDLECAPQSAARPVQMAMQSLARIAPGAGPVGGSKAAAILGGAPSKLEQMRMAQATGELQARAIVSILPLSAPGISNCALNLAPASPSFAPAPSFLVPENAILGTMSVSIKHTPFDRDWAMVSARQGSRKMTRALAATGARNSGDVSAQVEAINRWVNRKIEFGEDRDVYGRADYWASASETLRRGIGDCEDFAIAKMELLSALGIGRDKMRLVVARDLVRNADHAVLVVTLADGAVMLDNMTDRLLDARLPNDYRPIMSFSQNAKWVHGYAVQPAPVVRWANANVVKGPATSAMLDVMTVTREPEMPALSIALLSAPLVLPTSL